MLEVAGLSKRYGSIKALSDITLRIDAGEIVALVGENGAGKSTFVRCVARAISPTTGIVRVDGELLGKTPRDAIDQGVSVVWQDLALCENLDVIANLFLGREVGRRGTLDQATMHSAAESVFAGLNVAVPELDRPIERLSGGLRQLVAIARATLDLPKVLVLDEPTAALGVAESKTILNVIRTLRSKGVAILLVSHQLDKVLDVSDRIVVLRHGQQVADLHRAETHPDDLVALITGADVETTAGQQLRRLHSLSEQLAEAEPTSILPLTVTSLSGALHSDRLAIFLARDEPDRSVLSCSASLNLPKRLAAGIADIPVGSGGGFLGQAAVDASLRIIPHLTDLPDDPVAALAVESGLAGAWAAPIVGQQGTVAVIVGFTDSLAQLQPEQIQLLELFSTMAAAAVERGRLLDTLRIRNEALVGLQGVLEALAGPGLLQSGMSGALDALCRGVGCDVAELWVSSDDGRLRRHATSQPLGGSGDDVGDRDSMYEVIMSESRSPGFEVARFEWSRGSGVLACCWYHGPSPTSAPQVISGAANSFRLAMERELAAEAERESAALLKSREFERELTHRLGHELRTPLTAIRGFSSTLLQPDVEWSEAEMLRFIGIIDAQAGRMGRLVAQLFDDSSIDSGTLMLDFQYCDLAAVITQAMSIAGPDTSMTANIAGSFVVYGDKDRLEQVFVNLVTNALRHNPDDTVVEVTLHPPVEGADKITITVQDNGAGLPSDVLDYFNGHRHDFDRDRGMGVRLARGFVLAHGGCISARCSGVGTAIDISLPIETGAT